LIKHNPDAANLFLKQECKNPTCMANILVYAITRLRAIATQGFRQQQMSGLMHIKT
jgi:hypothetical protein